MIALYLILAILMGGMAMVNINNGLTDKHPMPFIIAIFCLSVLVFDALLVQSYIMEAIAASE